MPITVEGDWDLDELLYVVEIAANDRVKRVIDQNHQLKRGVVALCGNQLRNLEERLTLFYFYLILPEAREFTIVSKGHVRDDHVDLNGTRSRFFLCTHNLPVDCKDTHRRPRRARNILQFFMGFLPEDKMVTELGLTRTCFAIASYGRFR